MAPGGGGLQRNRVNSVGREEIPAAQRHPGIPAAPPPETRWHLEAYSSVWWRRPGRGSASRPPAAPRGPGSATAWTTSSERAGLKDNCGCIGIQPPQVHRRGEVEPASVAGHPLDRARLGRGDQSPGAAQSRLVGKLVAEDAEVPIALHRDKQVVLIRHQCGRLGSLASPGLAADARRNHPGTAGECRPPQRGILLHRKGYGLCHWKLPSHIPAGALEQRHGRPSKTETPVSSVRRLVGSVGSGSGGRRIRPATLLPSGVPPQAEGRKHRTHPEFLHPEV